jgi:CDP-diacylglycerol pyrophosphatase
MTAPLKRLAIAALVTGMFTTVGMTPIASANPLAWPPAIPICGTDADGGTIWNGVKKAVPTASPDNMGNQLVVWPNNDRSIGYAIHNGSQGDVEKWNLLMTPTVRITGIECPNLLAANAPPFFKDAADQVGVLPGSGGDWALGINALGARSENQLHIHMSKLVPQYRAALDQQVDKYATNENDWIHSYVVVNGYTYRAWNTATLNDNFFIRVYFDIVAKAGPNVQMADQTILVTRSHRAGGGYLVLNSDTTSDFKGQPVGNPGTKNSDFMLDRHATA